MQRCVMKQRVQNSHTDVEGRAATTHLVTQMTVQPQPASAGGV